MKSFELYKRALKVMPGGVNSPVRSFNAVGLEPIFMESACGQFITDCEGNKYLDYIGSWGPMILGNANKEIVDAVQKTLVDGLSFGTATEKEVEIAELIIKIVPNIEMVRMVNSGTEAVMSAIRLARGYTKKEKIIKFNGCYHGHADSMLVKAGSGAMATGVPSSSGVTRGTAKDTLVAEYNDIESVKKLLEENKDEVSAIIIEPVPANMGVILPKDNFLKDIRKLCTDNNVLLIFDEVITGFRLALGGAQEYFGVKADIVVFGKIIGGGLPVGAYCSSKEIMSEVSPLGSVYQAGTLSGNPLAMTAGLTMLNLLEKKTDVYKNINDNGKLLAHELRKISDNTVNQIGSLLSCFMTNKPVFDYNSAITSDTCKYAKMFNKMIDKGVYLAPAQFEAMFISNAHTIDDINFTIECFRKTFKEMENERDINFSTR